MIILDTSIWIEHLRNNQLFFPKVRKLLEDREVLAVECVFGELLQGVKNKSEKEVILSFWTYLPKLNYENIIIQAGEYSAQNKLLDHGIGLIDATILMHSIKSNSKIWTLDTKFLRVIPEELKYLDI
jgi:predicted nucleic acid-binding protein